MANDVAFLAMDLDYHGHPELSRYFSRRVADALGDQGMLRLLDFYKCYRAYVRGKVECFHQDAAELTEPERQKARSQAERYFRFALNYAVCGSLPMILIVAGRVGSGKSTLARSLGRELGWQVFSSDRTRKQLVGVPLYSRGDAGSRDRLYSETMTVKTYAELLRLARGEIKEEKSVILDATFGRRSHRDRLRDELKQAGISYRYIEAQAPESILKRRLKDREGEQGEVSDARLEDFEMINRSYEKPSEFGPYYLIPVNTVGPLGVILTKILKALTSNRLLIERS